MLQRLHNLWSAGLPALALACGACHAPGADAHPRAEATCRAAGGEDSVRWIEAAPAGQRPSLATWCATVGAPALVPMPAPPAPFAGDTLVVVSWNVHVGGGSIERLVSDLRAGRLTDGHQPGAFVLLLQEAYRGGDAVPPLPASAVADVPHRIAPLPPDGPRRDVIESARRLGLALIYVPSMRNGPGVVEPREDRGNAILSTLPLRDPAAVELPLETERRVALQAYIDARGEAGGAGWRLRVVSAHLDHRARWTRALASFGAARREQAVALADALQGTDAMVLGMDMNTWSAAALETAVPYLRSRFPSGPPEPRGATFHVAGIGRRLDHVFFRLPPAWTASVRIVRDTYGSDHFPLVTVLRIAP